MHFNGGVLGSGHAAGPENAHRHLEVPPELLTKNIGSQFGSAEKGVQALVDGHRLVDAADFPGIVVPLTKFLKRQTVRPVAIYLVSARETEWRMPTILFRRHQKIERSACVHVEVFERYRRGLVV
jgi:hypothetical protein